jgi:hypothetical protein
MGFGANSMTGGGWANLDGMKPTTREEDEGRSLGALRRIEQSAVIPSLSKDL